MRSLVIAVIAAAVLQAQYYPFGGGSGRGSGASFDKASWGLCTQGPCQTGTNLTVVWPVVYTVQPRICVAEAKTAPTGAPLTFDIKRSTGASILGPDHLSIAAGQTLGSTGTFAVASLAPNDYLTIDITSVGSTVTGQGISVACLFGANAAALSVPNVELNATAAGATGDVQMRGSTDALAAAPMNCSGSNCTIAGTLFANSIQSSQTGATRVNFTSGACPSTATTGWDYTMCVDTDGLKLVSAAGVTETWQTALGYTAENAANKGQVNGYAGLDSGGRVPTSQLPLSSGSAINVGPVVFDGSTTSLADGSSVTWSCGSGTGAQCTTTWTVPADVHWVRVQVWSGGGGGQGGNSTVMGGGGGGGGGYYEATCAVTPGAGIAVAVGLGGAGGVGGGTVGNNGGDSSFGTCALVNGAYGANNGYGGTGGKLSNAEMLYHSGSSFFSAITAGMCSPAAAAGYATVRDDQGACGAGTITAAGTAGKAGGAAMRGGAGGASGAYNHTTAGTGGVSAFGNTMYTNGGNGGNGGTYNSGTTTFGACSAGVIPAGGGGGGAAANVSGCGSGTTCNGCAGARGEVRVYFAK